MSLLYVTSFSEDLYNASGKRLINSFIEHKIEAPLLVCYENFVFPQPKPQQSQILTYALHESKYLQKWLSDNRDIIPDYLGGLATKQNHPEIFDVLMKRKASRFFRKVAALEYAVAKYGDQYDYIIWLDCDGYYIKNMPNQVIYDLFQQNAVIYHLGKWRTNKKAGIESGWIGFSKRHGGYGILKKIFDFYSSGQFRTLPKWDDGYVMRYFIANQPPNQIKCCDLTPKCTTSHPIKDDSPIRTYFYHEKGRHFKMKVSL